MRTVVFVLLGGVLGAYLCLLGHSFDTLAFWTILFIANLYYFIGGWHATKRTEEWQRKRLKALREAAIETERERAIQEAAWRKREEEKGDQWHEIF